MFYTYFEQLPLIHFYTCLYVPCNMIIRALSAGLYYNICRLVRRGPVPLKDEEIIYSGHVLQKPVLVPTPEESH